MVKKQKDELRKIQKEINPKLVKKLYKLLEKKSPEKITTMLEALVGLLRNSEMSSNKDVEVCILLVLRAIQMYLKKQEGLLYKMQKVDPSTIRDSVIEKHFETIKHIQKSFIDNTSEDYKECSQYAAFIAWASQFIVLCKDT